MMFVAFLGRGMRWPGNLGWTRKAMFFLYPDVAMRWYVTTGFIIFNCNEREGCTKSFEDDLSIFTAPDLDDVLVYVLIFILPRADRNRFPGHLHAVARASRFCPGRRW